MRPFLAAQKGAEQLTLLQGAGDARAGAINAVIKNKGRNKFYSKKAVQIMAGSLPLTGAAAAVPASTILAPSNWIPIGTGLTGFVNAVTPNSPPIAGSTWEAVGVGAGTVTNLVIEHKDEIEKVFEDK